ncbi:MAG: DUF5694 domain-containing protein [Bacteroidia bacterium]|nr:DUF5694 domain-containing protein [Bacteroidia bacterium]
MNFIHKFSFSLILLAMSFGQAFPQKSPKHQVLVLGSYHMNNPGMDVHNIEADDVLAEKRQKEIQDLVDMLAKFRPTKIAIERRWQTKSDTLARQRYAQYLKGEHTLSKSETQQVGFRLAKQLGHADIYPIDAPGNFPFNELVQYANENGQGDFFLEANAWMQNFIQEEQEYMKSHTVAEILGRHNDPERIKEGHGMYISMLQIGKKHEYPGANLVAEWYERNLKIHANLTRIVDQEEERILVIFGSGHAPILRELVQYDPDYELVEYSKFVK